MVLPLAVDLDPRVLQAAGLAYVTDAQPGITRQRAGKGFTYRMHTGARVSASERARIERLAIPPAWTDVWISADPCGHLQATGRDARGRKQYRYHPDWRRIRDEAKYDQLADFGSALTDLRRTLERDLEDRGLGKRKVVALVLSILDRTLIRIGNDEYARENQTYGLTTLQRRHVSANGQSIRLRFRGKSGLEHDVSLTDRRLVRLVRRCHELGGKELFTYLGADEELVRVDSSDCNDYLREAVGPEMTVKTFRTWGGSAAALEFLAHRDDEPPTERLLVAAIDHAAHQLGNTRAVCRSAYIHPAVLEAGRSGALSEVWRSARQTARMERHERALLRLLSHD